MVKLNSIQLEQIIMNDPALFSRLIIMPLTKDTFTDTETSLGSETQNNLLNDTSRDDR